VLYKIKTLPKFEFCYNRQILINKISYKYLKLTEFIETARDFFETYNKTQNTLVLYNIYELFCNTYVKTIQNTNELQCEYTQNKINFYIIKKMKNITNEKKRYFKEFKKK